GDETPNPFRKRKDPFPLSFTGLQKDERSEYDTKLPPALSAPKSDQPTTPTILVVEDEHLVRPVYCRMLEGVGFRVLEAADGDGAIQLSQQHPGPIDLLVTDVMMPRMNGLELANRLQQQRPKLKVLFVSGFMNMRELGREIGVSTDNVLQKPFMPEALIQ